MSKKVLVISSSLRNKSNSEILARQAAKGAEDAGHDVEFITLKDKTLNFCKGCLACQKTMRCVIRDDASEICEKVGNAEVLIFANPIYYYELCGQLKTLLDRCNPLYPSDYKFRDVYLITASAEDGDEVCQTAKGGLQGWVDCFEKARLVKVLSGGGLSVPAEAEQSEEYLKATYELGRNV
ncbi:flavodoxin family protein [Ruminococcus flavefaciens]|uniref:NADPH-dependent FMN reductase n=1 Tax=Ruminococcus flavefaciens 007c TaxID=1341157 RepID=W7UKV6_RUMFL|nr:flavodoxin family protein [Ruminococcus flavefaciens]EWM52194.1 NADPH-dependent FMN reductase [Ruminococcus flavefaciens 007c]